MYCFLTIAKLKNLKWNHCKGGRGPSGWHLAVLSMRLTHFGVADEPWAASPSYCLIATFELCPVWPLSPAAVPVSSAGLLLTSPLAQLTVPSARSLCYPWHAVGPPLCSTESPTGINESTAFSQDSNRTPRSKGSIPWISHDSTVGGRIFSSSLPFFLFFFLTRN